MKNFAAFSALQTHKFYAKSSQPTDGLRGSVAPKLLNFPSHKWRKRTQSGKKNQPLILNLCFGFSSSLHHSLLFIHSFVRKERAGGGWWKPCGTLKGSFGWRDLPPNEIPSSILRFPRPSPFNFQGPPGWVPLKDFYLFSLSRFCWASMKNGYTRWCV